MARSGAVLAVVLVAVGCGGKRSPEEPRGLVDVRGVGGGPQGRVFDVRHRVLRERAIAMLVQSARSDQPQVRANAVEGLILAPESLAEVLPAALLDENLGVRSVAAVAAGRAQVLGQEQVLRGLLTDESPYVRASAIFALVRMGATVDRGPLAGFLLDGDPVGVRAHTAYLLGELGDPSAVPLLRSALRAPSRRASEAERRLLDLQLSEAMIKLGDFEQLGPVRAALYPSQPSDLEATALAVQIVGEVGDRASRGRLVQLAELTGGDGGEIPPEIQLGIAIAMAKLGTRDGWFVAEEFDDAERAVLRADSAAVYGWTRRESDLDRLGRLLDDPEPTVRVAAAAAALRALGS